MKKIILIVLFSCYASLHLLAQDSTDIMNQLEKDTKKVDYTFATFKSTRVINGHSVETLGKGVLDFRIMHRFGPVNRGLYDFFGFDYASMRMSFEYGLTNNIMIGVGHSTWEKTYDVFYKAKLLRQSTGAVNMPFTLSYFGSMATRTDKIDQLDSNENRVKPGFSNRTSYAQQLIIGRKISSKLSLQLMPTFIFHHNKVDSIKAHTLDNDNIITGQTRKNTFALGIGGRIKISKRVSFNAEYFYQLPDAQADKRYNSIAFGIDIETGGHVFQLHFTNSNGMTEKSFITDTDDKWERGAIRFGFNLSRVFTIGKHREPKTWN